MARPPLTIFSSTIDPIGVLEALRPNVASTKGSGSGWREARVDSSTGSATVRHDPAYYADSSWSEQLPGMFNYFRAAPTEVLALIRSFRFSLSVTGDEDSEWQVAQTICRHLDGAIFVPGNLLDAEGRCLASTDGDVDADATLPRAAPPHPLLAERGALYDRTAPRKLADPQVRAASCDALERLGFAGAYGLPQDVNQRPRPVEEIATRLMALHALFAWVSRDVPDEELRQHALRNQLLDELTGDDRAAFEGPRQQARAEAWRIGWRLENMWPLAWALGFEPQPSIGEGMIDPATQARLEAFLPRFTETRSSWLARQALRSERELVRLEDLFYCAHHAVRSAQLARATVPPAFHPIRDGGVVHERRHALTWILSPGTPWDETDLST